MLHFKIIFETMKTSYIIEAILAIALVVACGKLAASGKADGATSSADSVALSNIMTRASVRAYQDKPVEDSKIEKMLRAAMASPSGMTGSHGISPL